jgi:hypothetical protein
VGVFVRVNVGVLVGKAVLVANGVDWHAPGAVIVPGMVALPTKLSASWAFMIPNRKLCV